MFFEFTYLGVLLSGLQTNTECLKALQHYIPFIYFLIQQISVLIKFHISVSELRLISPAFQKHNSTGKLKEEKKEPV